MTFANRNVTLVLLILGVAAACYMLGIRHSVTFWSSDDDYAYLSLSHALSFQQWIAGEPNQVNGGLVIHPGIPFYLTSAMAFKIAVPAAASSFAQVLGSASDAVERFWLVSRAMALILSVCGLAMIFHLGRNLAAGAVVVATLLFLAASPQAWVAMTRLGNESFALLYATLFYAAARLAFLQRTRSIVPWLVFGAVGGLGYTIKVHYIAFALAALAGLLTLLVVRSCRPGEALKLAAAYVIGFLLAFVPAALFFIGGNNLLAMLRFHFAVVVHSDYYATGDATIVSPALVLRALGKLALMPTLLAAFALVLAGALWTMRARWPQRDWRSSALPLGVSLVAALVISFAVVLKQFAPYYLTVPLAVVPLLFLFIIEYIPQPDHRRRFVMIAVGLAVLSLPFTLRQFSREQARLRENAARLVPDIASIESRPLGPDELRVWDYRVPARGFAVGFVVAYAGSPAILEWYQRENLRDRYAQILPHRAWRYAILDKATYRNPEVVRTGWWGYKEGDRIEMLDETVIVERAPDAAK